MTKIIPTIGRVVWFFQSAGSPEPNAAIVTYVHSPVLVNLTVFNANGEPFPATSVPLYADGGSIALPEGFRCEWMPYQKGQAAKTEELEKKLAL